jgi:nucleoside phosphorylase
LATGLLPFVGPGFFLGYLTAPPPSTTTAVAADNESASVARVAAAAGIPFVAFRAVSDGAGDPLHLPGFPVQFFVYARLAAHNAAAATAAFLSRWTG